LQTPYASPISAMSAAPSHSAATTTVTPSVSAPSFDSQQPTSSTSPELQTHYVSPIASNSGVINVTDDFVVTKDLEDAAVLFINETIEMAKRSELLPTSITPAPRDRRVPTEPRAGSKRPSNKKAKQAMARRSVVITLVMPVADLYPLPVESPTLIQPLLSGSPIFPCQEECDTIYPLFGNGLVLFLFLRC
jgi:hypothetical protein